MSKDDRPKDTDEYEVLSLDPDAFYREVFDSAIDTAVIGTDLQGSVISWSAGAKHITGWDAAEMLGRPLDTIFTPEDRAAGRPAMEMRAAAQSGRATDVRWHLRKDGGRFYAHGSISPLKGPVKGYVKSFRDATVQHQTERALLEGRETYRSLFNSIDAGFCIVQIEYGSDNRAVDYRFVEVNAAFAGVTGLEDATGNSIRELVPTIEQYWVDIYAQVAETGESIRFENRAEALQGRWYDVYAFRIGNPTLKQVAILFNDISAKKRAEIDLRLNKTRLDNALSIAALGTFDWNPRTNSIVFSTRSLQIFGFAAGEQPSSADIIARVHPEDYARGQAQAMKLLATRARRSVEYRVIHPNGDLRYVKSVSDVVHEDAETEQYSGVHEDVTEQRLAEQQLEQANENLQQRVKIRSFELAQSETRFRAYFDASPECLYLLRLTAGDEWVFDDVNPAGAELYGISREAILGRTPYDINDAAEAATFDSQCRAALSSGATQYYETQRRVSSRGLITINTVVAPITTSDNSRYVLLSGRDLTDQRQAEEALRQSQKMEAIGQLTGGIAHDFNNLLAAVMGALELMARKISMGRVTELERYIAAAQSASTRAAALTHRLLAFSRRQTLSPALTDVNRLVQGMEELLRRTLGPSIEMDVAATEQLWMTQVDQSQLESALLNLCINSRDAMPSGGRLTIETSNFEVDQRMASEGQLLVGQYVSVSVSDTGIGMTPPIIARAFDPFFTTKPLGSGTGLGLSMIYGFAKQSGGHVRIYSEVGRGSTITLYLPRFLTQVEAEKPVALATSRNVHSATILVVDDEESVRMLIVEALQELGHTVIQTGDGASGLETLRSKVQVDLLVTDVGLPGINGRQLADAARVLRPDLKVLFITGYAENAIINHGHLNLGMQILTKPFMMETLRTTVQAMIRTE